MAKTKISEFSTTPGNNTDINGINIAEGCAPSGINNAIRELMSDLKEWQSGAMDVYVIPQGTAAAPGIQLYGDLDTGLYGYAANQLGVAVGGASAGYFSSAGWVGNVNGTITGDINATTIDTTNLEVTNIKAKDGTAAITIANSTGLVTVSSELAVDNISISGNAIGSSDTNGNIFIAPNGSGDIYLAADLNIIGDGGPNVYLATSAASDLVLQTNLGTNSGSIRIEDGVNGDILIETNGTGQIKLTGDLDVANIETGAIKARDGTASATIANSTGVMTIASSVLTSADINGGTIDGTIIGGSTSAAGTFTTVTATTGNITTVNATTVDTTNIEVTDIKAKDGTAGATIANSTGQFTFIENIKRGVLELGQPTGLNIAMVKATNTNGSLILQTNGTGSVFNYSDSVVIVPSGTTANLTTDTGCDLVLDTNTGTSSGSVTIQDGVNGNILIATNGTGQVQVDAPLIGLNKTATTWDTGLNVLQMGSGAVYADVVGRMTIAANSSYDGSMYTYIEDGDAARYSIVNGQHRFYTASSGLEGDEITDYTQQVTISSSGLAATTVDTTNLEVTNIKAKDGTAALSIADSTGVVSVSANPVLSGGTANGVVYLNASKVATSGTALVFDGTNLSSTGGATFLGGPEGYGGGEVILGGASAGTNNAIATGGTSSPTLFFDHRGTSNTGLFRWRNGTGAANELMRLTAGGQLNLGGNFTSTNNTLQVTGNAAIGYTTAAPTTGLIVAGNVGVGTASPITFSNQTSVTVNGTNTGRFDLKVGDTHTGALVATSSVVDLTAVTNIPLTFGTNSTERMRLDASGNLGLGVTPSAWASGYNAFQFGSGTSRASALFTNGANDLWQVSNAFFNGSNFIYYANGAATAYNQSSGAHNWRTAASGTAGNTITFTQAMTLDASGELRLRTDGGTARYFAGPTGAEAYFGYNSDGTAQINGRFGYAMLFSIGNTERARITSGGNLDLQNNIGLGGASATTSGTGITFPATQNASSNANTLDDYEEGTWTPTVFGNTTAGTTTYTTQTGTYTKVGRVVTVNFRVAYSAATGTGNFEIGGLPFASGSTTHATGAVMADNLNWGGTGQLVYYTNNNSAMSIWRINNDAAWVVVQVANESADLIGTVTYSV